MIVRPARGGELDRIGELVADAYLADGLLPADHPYVDELRAAAHRAEHSTLLVAVDGGQLLGTVTIADAGSAYAEIARAGEVEFRMLAVAPLARGRGAGRALVRAVLDHARTHGADAVTLTTLEEMRTAQRIYESLGFRRAPDRDWAVGARPMLVYTADLRAGGAAAPAPTLEEEVASWPPLQVVDIDGWRAGLSGGFTRRGNSVVAAGAPADPESALDSVEALYAGRGLPAVVRVCGRSRPDGLDEILARRGYRVVAPTTVMTGAVGVPAGGPDREGGGTVTLADEPDRAWLDGWLDVKSATAGAVDPALAERLVRGAESIYLTSRDADGVVGVLRAAFVGEWVALSCLVVVERARRRGVARLLTEDALSAAARRGARRAFLQVEATNAPAVGLYRSLGFLSVDSYHYRQRP